MSDYIANPGFDEALDQLERKIFSTLNCVQVGRIESVSDEQTAEISIVMKARRGDVLIDYPLLVDCPVFVLQGGGAYIDMPITPGDYCIVLFNDRDIDNWWSSENVKEPRTRRKHNLSDGIALVGINPSTTPLPREGSKVRVLGTSGEGAEKPAARTDDEIQSTPTEDTAFWSWVTTISAAVNTLAPGSVPNVPSSLTGKITGGSNEVDIG